MKPAVYKTLTWVILPLLIVFLAYMIVAGVMKPVKFEKERAYRQTVAVERLKDIRTLQTAFKGETGHYASTIDSLKAFYRTGDITINMMIGSQDDSIAVENTKALKKKQPKITPQQMLALSQAGERLVFTIKSKIAVADTLCKRAGFNIDSTFVIPFCGEPVEMNTTIKMVSGVPVPLFEACIPWRKLLKGMDNQLRINLDAELIDTDRYPGLMVGSVSAPNNNAGNWE